MTKPTFTTESERHVWQTLTDAMPPDWQVVANVRLMTERRDHEVDLVVLIPDAGIVVAEVKGGSVYYEDGGWWLTSGGQTRSIDPMGQVSDGLYELRRYVEEDPRWSGGRVRWTKALIAPYTDFADDFAAPESPRWAVHGRRDMDDLPARLEAAARKGDLAVPSAAQCDLLREILAGRSLPVRDVVALAAEHEARAERLTAEQATLLKVTRLLNRVEVRGGAGSGKTVLALAQARELARGSAESPAQRVALVCYSIGLAAHFKRLTETWPRRQRPAFVGTFEELGRYCGIEEFGARDNPDFWERELPEQIAAKAAELPDGKRFDSFVVDEAQDFADLWWQPVVALLRDPDQGGLYVYSDENQRVFDRFGRPPMALVPLVLDRNLRNTKQIAEAFRPLAPARMYAGGDSGPDVELVRCTSDEAINAADDVVDSLFEDGWEATDIALLTTGRRHPVQVEQQESLGQEGYWRSFWDGDDVFYGHVLGCKGLERRVVILCVNEKVGQERARERLYVGMSRATEQLIVVGDPDVIAEIGGPGVAARLGCG